MGVGPCFPVGISKSKIMKNDAKKFMVDRGKQIILQGIEYLYLLNI